MCTGSSDPRPSADVEESPPQPWEGGDISGTALPSPGRVEMPHPQGQEGGPEPPQSGDVGDPITISDGSGGDPLSKDARTTGRRSRPLLLGNRRRGLSGSTPSRRGGESKRKGVRKEKKKKKNIAAYRGNCRKRRRGSSCYRGNNSSCRWSSRSCSRESASRNSWSNVGSKSCRSFNGSNSSRVSSWKSCLSSDREARAS